MMTHVYKLSLTVAFGILAGCSTQKDNISEFINDPGVKPSRIKSLPVPASFPTIEYNRNLVRDPFIAQLNVEIPITEAPVEDLDKQALEYFPTDSLKMIGMVIIENKPYALIRDTELQVHRVTLGQRMGQNYGKVIQISKNGVDLKEKVRDSSGNWIEVDRRIDYQEIDQFTTSTNRTTR